ncbi:putative ER-Golgi trafficking TRAPP I complex 85 kDa subunit [Lyophyllum shimeji]|uniref:ER-Golgi trafficking TRAPP I complex 85 kDa subunit n=1 Tax=Lyophyllum shimeji TaxID=47721 RepID=A0A9P3PIL7_LYOSH|nr:putative ER-Golgi trafficking TRAPP I complex 85 kDa subunit [Lyophyllum shimeji]
MPPPLPFSLSPHICILPSQDLTELLASSSLPSLPHILQSFSPLPQVTTRTTALVSVPHTSFALRFSDLVEIETACREDEEQRAVRTIDWIGARINRRCAKWMEDVEKLNDRDAHRTPWWDELRRCTEGDHVPSKTEAWNHPVAIILAVSTTAPNPLQAITALHSRALELPSWVDPNILRYTLIIHPENSPLSDEEAGALFNAVKKQFGLHSYLLPLALPTPPPPPVPVPAPIPRLSPPPPSESPSPRPPVPTPAIAGFPAEPSGLHTLRMAEKDIQQTARFAREFLVMSLLPWMEKCAVEWNENFTSTRRLPSRLFSSTRRLFGSPSPSPAPTHNPSSSVSSLPSRSSTLPPVPGSSSPSAPPPSQHRRLAEFSTILGDLKLAVTVWEALRKEGKGGSDILPLLLSPSPAVPLHASSALSGLHIQSADPRPLEQLTALKYAVRWEAGISASDFLSYPLEGERWLVWAAGNSEEPPSALLLAHAALLSSGKSARRRAALWYLSAANRLEKCGIKPLTMFFLRRAHELYKERPQKLLSPSFWDAEGQSPLDVHGIDAIMSGIEHPLGRLLYTTGDVAGAVRYFLGLLRGSSGFPSPVVPIPFSNGFVSEGTKFPGTDKVFLDDFRVAYAHFKATSTESHQLGDLKLPFTFCLTRQTRLRLPSDIQKGSRSLWETREEQWKTFSKSLGRKEGLSSNGKASVDETFWIDLVLQNPLDTDVNLSNLTVLVEDSRAKEPSSSAAFAEVETISDVLLGPKESRMVPIGVKSTRAGSLVITHATYDFLSLLPCSESLASRGRRLHDTPPQRQKPTYAPDRIIKVEVEEVPHKLLVDFVDNERLVLVQGERKRLKLWFSNAGSRLIREAWMVSGPEDGIWLGSDEKSGSIDIPEAPEVIRSLNSLSPEKPHRIQLSESGAFNPGDSLELAVQLHAESVGDQELHLLFVYREEESEQYRTARVSRYYEVHKLLETSVTARPCQSLDYAFLVQLEILSVFLSSEVHLTQVTGVSPTWKCSPIAEHELGSLPPFQASHLLFGTSQWDASPGSQETLDFVTKKLNAILNGKTVEASEPPPIDLLCSHMSETTQSLARPSTLALLHRSKRTITSRAIAQSHPHIPSLSYPYIFPLYNPAAIDFLVFWEIPSHRRSGHITVSGLALGAGHAALGDIIQEAEGAKVKRSMYAETQREKAEVLDAIRNTEWNTEVNPLVLLVQEPATLHHDFSHGPRRIPITLTIRNYSLSHKSRYVLRLNPNVPPNSATLTRLPPPYTGRLTFRGILGPAQTTIVRPELWITRPGTYGLGGWSLETYVLERSSLANGVEARVRRRYQQESPLEDRSSLVVCDIWSP